jgi:hypothetical protein
VTRFGQILAYQAVFVKNAKEARFFVDTFFRSKSYVLILTKNGLDKVLGDFFKDSLFTMLLCISFFNAQTMHIKKLYTKTLQYFP